MSETERLLRSHGWCPAVQKCHASIGPGALSAVLGVAFLYPSLGGIASSESIRGRGVQPQVMRQTIGEVCESLNPGGGRR